ncbi:PepSY-associated TM helix domain-containing protein [Nocardioides sp.]|uniref:PepSY-associated TM helix domain-containing protein n=1 Tax=Nocardioides sp. TaxID=35761 RepID=UPI0035154D4E
MSQTLQPQGGATGDAPRRPGRPGRAGTRSAGLFRAAWRWHFFASALVLPIVLVLAATGLVYLFRFQLEPLLHPGLMRVAAPSAAGEEAAVVPATAQAAAVEESYPGVTLLSFTEPTDADDPSRFSVMLPDGSAVDVFVDPYRGEVLGDLDPTRTVSGMAIRLHGDLMSGRWGEHLVELGACWAIVMALTGYYLFWRGRAARRRAWEKGRPGSGTRSRHAVVGAVVGVALLGLLVTGLPWTGVWGDRVQHLATAEGSSMWSQDPGAISDPTSTLDESLPHAHRVEVPWGQQESPVSRSTPPHRAGDGASVADLDTAIAVADRAGLAHPLTVALPFADDDAGVFSVIGYAFHDPAQERTVHVDRYSGAVVGEYGFADYPLLAQVVSQGIGLHEGRSLGLWSFWGAAAACLLLIFLCVTGPLMWWRRRPSGGARLGAPRGRLPVRSSPLLAIGLVVLGVVLPLFGISLIAVLAIDQLVLRRIPALAGYFDVVD